MVLNNVVVRLNRALVLNNVLVACAQCLRWNTQAPRVVMAMTEPFPDWNGCVAKYKGVPGSSHRMQHGRSPRCPWRG